MKTSRPNILLILTDQQSASMMSCAGNSFLKTPQMDTIAGKGLRFTRANAANPVCVPSRYSLMTGKLPSEIGMKENGLEGVDHWTEQSKREALGRQLRDNGYTAWYGGKVHLPYCDYFRKISPANHHTNLEELGYIRYSTGTDGERDLLGVKTAELIRKEHDGPWFITASFINPHDICYLALGDFARTENEKRILENSPVEMQMINDLLQNYDPACGVPLPENHDIQSDEPAAIKWQLDSHPFKKQARDTWTAADWQKHRWVYHRLTESADTQMKPIIDALNETDAWRNTLVIFTSDHGDHAGSHRLEHKTILYREAMEVPLIIADPEGRQGETEDSPVSNGLDLYPTICEYAGIQLPSARRGMSLKENIRNGKPLDREAVPVECEIGSACVTGDYIYARYDFGANREQLYDLGADPGQTRNHAGNRENEGVLMSLRQKHREIFKPPM